MLKINQHVMYDVQPCPFAGNCEKATPACSFEKSGTCPGIAKPKEEPAKLYDPLEPVAVTLTREQWHSVMWTLYYYKCVCVNKAIEYADWPEHARPTESAAEHKAEAKKMECILDKIEQDYYGEQ
jgi:hypothetical protein